MAKGSFHGPLEQVDSCCWRIPKSYKPGMRVDGMIFANEALLSAIQKDQAPEQVANVAFLPGIQGASLAMPDIHWGYGFCIGGVCATDPDEGGVISPGGVGYDINCLTGESQILHSLGYTRRIDEMAHEWRTAELSCFALEEGQRNSTTVERWFGQKPKAPVLQVVLESGDEIRATGDHPFWTPDGMIPLGDLKPNDQVGFAPFEGTPYEEPTDDVLVSEDDLTQKWQQLQKKSGGNGLSQVIRFLKKHDLLPLHRNSTALPYLCRILGFVFGDGHVSFTGGDGKGVVHFYGKADDLELIRADVQKLGFTPSRVYTRQRQHTIQTPYNKYEFERDEESFKVVGSGFALLLACLGAPVGRKSSQEYDPPLWLDDSPLWHRRLFLAALFGAEMNSPSTVTEHDTVFNAPVLSMNKHEDVVESGKRFLLKISQWLSEFGVATQSTPVDVSYHYPEGGSSHRIRLVISSTPENLIRLWSRVGFDYHREKTRRAGWAIQYLKHKQLRLAHRGQVIEQARELRLEGVGLTQIVDQFADGDINRRFIERALYSKKDYQPRVGDHFPTFETFCEQITRDAPGQDLIWERIQSIETIEDFEGEVYDFTVSHDDHNFVANGFVVSNCGVRLVRSNLFYRQVKRQIRPLIEQLFNTVPAGVGRSGRFKFNQKELTHVMEQGPRYLMNRDLGQQSDIDYAEAEARLNGAEPDRVSDHAIKRGLDQCGTLGSGNHFMEVQVVDHVFDEEAAQVMGLEKDMVCVMIHSGSRGLGYQVCDDALASLRNAPQKYGIDLPDRQLACAPIDSPEGQHYIGAMRAAANYAWCNRQLLMQQAREVFEIIFGETWQSMQMNLVYDVAHNIAKLEEHTVGGKKKKVWVHRKGATRAFPAGHPEIPEKYRHIGQPVLIPGDMGRASWVLAGQPGSMEKTFGTTCHGAGRAMSRTASVKDVGNRRIDKELEGKGVIARARSRKGLAEEQPNAYKNVDDVVDVVHEADLSRKVARMRPIGVIKG